MRPNVVQLREFYASALGKRVRHALTLAVRDMWPELAADTLCGVGYANPILRRFLRQEKPDNASVFSLMPAAQGAVVWPDYGANRTVLNAPCSLPLRDNQVNRLLLLHALEHSEDEEKLLAECWRVLCPGGRMLLVVPNRLSSWSRMQKSPFASGKPYSSTQLREVVCGRFTHLRTRGALAFPPCSWRWLLRFSGFIERFSPYLAPMFGGVIVMEVEKQIYAGIKERKKEKPLGKLVPAAAKPALSKE